MEITCSGRQRTKTCDVKRIIQGILLLMLPLVSCDMTCNSRYYCVTEEFKYVSMDRVPKVYLNTTTITTHVVNKTSECQNFCMKEENCTSINLKLNESKGYECHLLNGNKFSNSSLLVKDERFTHLYIPSKCDNNPCMNGGVCVPIYYNDTYICECKSNGSWISRGRHCETILDGYKSAFIYYSLNNVTKRTPHTSTDLDVSVYSLVWKGIWVPDRASPVAVCKHGGTSCAEISVHVPYIQSFGSANPAVTYSIWVKFLSAQLGQQAHIFRTSSTSGTIVNFTSNADGYDFKCSMNSRKTWYILDFGRWVVQTNWNQFTITIDENSLACAYINGLKEKCQSSPMSVTLSASSSNKFIIGGDGAANSEPMMYFDDFGVWKFALKDHEVMNLYNLSKG